MEGRGQEVMRWETGLTSHVQMWEEVVVHAWQAAGMAVCRACRDVVTHQRMSQSEPLHSGSTNLEMLSISSSVRMPGEMPPWQAKMRP